MKLHVDTDVLDRLIRKAPGALEELLDMASQSIVDDIKLSFGTGPAGRVYVRGRRSHIASVQGNPPNVDTGALRASLYWKRSGRFKRMIADGVPYGVNLEMGIGVGRRPFMRPVLERWARVQFGALAKARVRELLDGR